MTDTTHVENNPFITARLDGRSDRRVIADLIEAGQANDLYTYAQLADALQKDAPGRSITRQTIAQAVRAANKISLVECSRLLQAVPRVGYRIAAAEDHRMLALDRRRRADNQIRMAVHTLQHVRWDEMEPTAREAHRATLTLMAGIWQAVESMKQRQDRMEKVLESIVPNQA